MEMRPKFDAVFSSRVPPLLRLEHWCQAVYDDQKDKHKATGRVCGCPFANVGSELGTQDEALRVKSLQMLERGSRYLESAIADERHGAHRMRNEIRRLGFHQDGVEAATGVFHLAYERPIRYGRGNLLAFEPQAGPGDHIMSAEVIQI